MSAQDIRLRLAIRRHGVPEVRLIWPCARSPDMTISKLLTLVNEVVPLESTEWGLEDYAVELEDGQGGGYECLHFQQIAQILKDEDQVAIRCLLTDDLRRRRLSGRHQISTDGKHLVDGLAFGRPWLRTPRDRPAMELPPRKKARIEYDDTDDPEPLRLEAPSGFGTASSVHLRSGLDDDDRDGDDEWQEDEDFEPDQEDEGSVSEDGDDDAAVEQSPTELDEELKLLAQDGDGSDISQSSSEELNLEQIQTLRAAFPLLSASTIEKELVRQNRSLVYTYEALRLSTTPSLSFDDMMERMATRVLGRSESSPVQAAMPHLLGLRPAKKPLIQVVASEESDTSTSETSYDSSSSDSSSSEAEKAPTTRVILPKDSIKMRSPDSSSDTSPSYESASDSADEDFDDGSDGSADDGSSVSDDSESEAESEAVQETSRPVTKPTGREESAPFTGLSRTQKRNLRRKRAKLSQHQDTSTPESRDAEFLARKEAILRALEPADEPTSVNGEVTHTPEKTPVEKTSAGETSSAQRRARVDMGAGRRMLFGALGLKNPKSKADEERIKEGLMKNVKPLNNARIVEVADDDDVKQAAEEDDDPGTWKSKITYRAVECCHEGMVLSEPPFPFVQRWDPQQQFSSMRKRKRNSQAYGDDSYVDEASGIMTADTETNGKEGDNKAPKAAGRDPFGNLVNEADDGAGDDAHDAAAQDDLPALPEDLSSLAKLDKGAAKEGMVITWKQCIMSKATQWQPVIASLTGEILPGGNDDSLEVRLAMRDRDDRERIYDDNGQRIYDKFDVPDFEEEDEDDGHRTVAWDEMNDARILQVEKA